MFTRTSTFEIIVARLVSTNSLILVHSADTVALRPATKGDFDFLWRLHRATMKPYVEETWGWDEEWQRQHFADHFDAERLHVVEKGGERIGRFAVERGDEGLFIASIEIAPAHQRAGIGTALIGRVLRKADAAALPVTLRVLKANPARRLYERLGFARTAETETHFIMKRAPNPPA